MIQKTYNKTNYQLYLNHTLEEIKKENKTPKLLLHVCCAPCSSYCLEYLSQYFFITVYFYNPNISPEEEYKQREKELRRFIAEMKFLHPVRIIEGNYDPEQFEKIVKGLEQEPEGGRRCPLCYMLRLKETARVAKEEGFDYFTTTLSISPYKDAEKLNEIGKKLEEVTGVSYLYSDFKKRGGYQRSIELSREYQLYRQDYCGCKYSKEEKENKKSAF